MVLDHAAAISKHAAAVDAPTYPCAGRSSRRPTVELAHRQLQRPQRLRKENARLEARARRGFKLLQFDSLNEENRRLRAIRERIEASPQRTSSPRSSRRRRSLPASRPHQQGRRDGVFKGQPILDAFGVVGQVSGKDTIHSEVILISDSEHAIPVQVNRNGIRSIAVGTGDLGQAEPAIPDRRVGRQAGRPARLVGPRRHIPCRLSGRDRDQGRAQFRRHFRPRRAKPRANSIAIAKCCCCGPTSRRSMSMSRPPNPTRTDPSNEPRRPQPRADAAERAGAA